MVLEKFGERKNLPIPDARELPPGTLRALIKQMNISVDDFLRLLRS